MNYASIVVAFGNEERRDFNSPRVSIHFGAVTNYFPCLVDELRSLRTDPLCPADLTIHQGKKGTRVDRSLTPKNRAARGRT